MRYVLNENTELCYSLNELDVSKHDTSKSWIKKNMIGKQGVSYSQKNTFLIDNVLIDNTEKIANELNNFFVSIGPKLATYITFNVKPLFYVNSVMIISLFNVYLLLMY